MYIILGKIFLKHFRIQLEFELNEFFVTSVTFVS